MALSAEPRSSESRRLLASRVLFLLGIALALAGLVSAVVGAIWAGQDADRGDIAVNAAVTLDATVIVVMIALLLSVALGRTRSDRAQRWRGPCLLGMGILSIVVIVSARQYLRSIGDSGAATLVAFYTGILASVCLVSSVIVRHRRAQTTGFAESTQLRPVMVAVAIAASVTGLALTGFALVQGVPDQVRLADDSVLLGPLRLGFGVASGVAVATALIVLITRTSDETVKFVGVLLAGIGGVTLAWLVMFRVPTGLRTAYDVALIPGVHESSSVTMIGVIAAATAGIAAIGLVAESVTRADGADESIAIRPIALALVACFAVGSSAAIGLHLHQGELTRTSSAADAPAYTYPTVPGPADYRIELRDNPARSVVPTGNGFAFFDRNSLVAYDGVTGTERWRMDLALLDRAIPGRREFQGLDSHRFLIANGSGTSSTLTMVGDNDRVVTVDAITGRVLWSTTDDVYLLDTSRRATSRDALVGVRTLDDRTDIVSIDPRSGRTLWARPTLSKCSPRGDIIGTSVALTDSCELRDAVEVVDTRSGATRPTARVGHSGPINARGDVFAVGPSSESGVGATTTLIDPRSGAVVETLVGEKLQSTVHDGHYLSALPSGELAIRTISSPRRIEVSPRFEPVAPRSPAVWIGEELTAITTTTVYGPGVVTTNPRIPDGIGEMPLPCPSRSERSSLINVPGALLVLCIDENRRGAYEIVGSGDVKTR